MAMIASICDNMVHFHTAPANNLSMQKECQEKQLASRKDCPHLKVVGVTQITITELQVSDQNKH